MAYYMQTMFRYGELVLELVDSTTAWTYSMGYIKALWKCAMEEVNR